MPMQQDGSNHLGLGLAQPSATDEGYISTLSVLYCIIERMRNGQNPINEIGEPYYLCHCLLG